MSETTTPAAQKVAKQTARSLKQQATAEFDALIEEVKALELEGQKAVLKFLRQAKQRVTGVLKP